MIVKDMDGYWMVRAAIGQAKSPDDELPVEIFIAGPPTASDGIDGLLIQGLAAFINLRNALNEEYDNWQSGIELSSEDI